VTEGVSGIRIEQEKCFLFATNMQHWISKTKFSKYLPTPHVTCGSLRGWTISKAIRSRIFAVFQWTAV